MNMNIKKFKNEETGATTVIVALCMVILLSFAGLALDFGAAYSKKVKMQSACDNAALAAAKDLPDLTAAEKTAKDYASANGIDPNKVKAELMGDGSKIRVSIADSQPTGFSKIVGVDNLDVAVQAVAKVEIEYGKQDFEYAIFSGNETAALNFGWGQYYIEGKVHSNGTMNVSTHMSATQYTANKGGYISIWNAKNLIPNSDGSYTAVQAKDKPDPERVIEMPYYLGDNMNKVIKVPTLPSEEYWEKTIRTGSWQTDSDKGADVKQALADGKRTHVILTSGGDKWFNYSFSGTNDIYVECNSSFKLQPRDGGSIFRGDIYLSAPKGCDCKLYFPSETTIIGNIYCLSGNLNLGNAKITGNIYCAGDLGTDGGTLYIDSKFVYANTLKTSNSTIISGTIVTEGNAHVLGGQNTVNSDSTLSVYSRSGDIIFDTANSDIHGIIFAPYGTIRCKASVTIYGKAIADQISLESSKISLSVLDRDVGFDLTDPNLKPKDKTGKLVA